MSVLAWSELMVEELFRCGVDTYFVAPGSRSTPLVSAIARHPGTKIVVHFDERGTAFAALGYGRISNHPAAWVTTSGTAVANGLPAVVEASADNIPLLLLTADRPPELRDTGANQTINQPGIFGSYVRWFFDMPVEIEDVDPAFVLTTVDYAVHKCRAESGPVHLNCMYRKPLELSVSNRLADGCAETPHLDRWQTMSFPYSVYEPTSLTPANVSAASGVFQGYLAQSERPVLLMCGGVSEGAEREIINWASQANIPVFPDIGSRLRLKNDSQVCIPYWDLLCDNDPTGHLHPDLVVQFGHPCVSTRWDDSDAVKIVIAGVQQRVDPAHRVAYQITADSQGMLAISQACVNAQPKDETWLTGWIARNQIVDSTLESISIGPACDFSEEMVAHQFPALLPANSVLLIGNSMPVRNMNRWGGFSPGAVTPVLSRGASGIDGTVAQAVGLRQASGRPTAVMLGDQALLHDMNSLAMLEQTPVLVVVINNDGGRIFHRLPVSGEEDIFEPLFVNSRGLRFESAAAQFGISYAEAASQDEFKTALEKFSDGDNSLLIEIQIEYVRNEEIRRNLEANIADALASMTGI